MKRKLIAICLCLFIATFVLSAGFTIASQTAEARPPCEDYPNCPPGPCYSICDGCCFKLAGHLVCMYQAINAGSNTDRPDMFRRIGL